MITLVYIYIFILGAIFGSFFNVVAIRVTNKQSLLESSSCPVCKNTLRWYDLIPVLSYIFLGGKCRYCNTKIPLRYFIFETLTGLLFLFMFIIFGFTNTELYLGITLVSLLMIVSISDILYMEVPDKVLLVFLPIVIILRIVFPLNPIYDSLYGAAFGFGFLYLLAWLSLIIYKKQGMGGGDIKLYGIIGIILGFKLTVLSIFIASLIGAIFGIIYNRISKKEDHIIPFVPFIAIGVLISFIYGNIIIGFYLNILGF